LFDFITTWLQAATLRSELLMVQPDSIKLSIEQGMSCDFVNVVGDGQHFEAVIVSNEFAGKRLVQQHQIVYKALGDRMKSEIHALSMKTYTPEQWAEVTR
jgi:acid stress-induced BolA-like protein IbaG/YrbA